MIKRFHALYVGQIELDNIGRDGTPANDRRYSSERLSEVFETSREVARVMDLTDAQVQRAFADFQRKKRTTEYLRMAPAAIG